MDPVIRWAGSKRALVPTLSKYWPSKASRYVEPFCGSGCLFFALEPRIAILSDINAELITSYRALRRDPARVIECLLRLRPSESTYYRLRELDPTQLSDAELAARFFFLNRFCFNGIYRTNLAGKFNVPYGPPKGRFKFSPSRLLNASVLLRRVTLLDGDFEKTLAQTKRGDFVYLDPPYAVSTRRVFAQYHPQTFTAVDLKRLRSALVDLDRRGVTFVISYAESPEGRELVSSWSARRLKTRRNVAGFAGHRRAAYELLASNLELDS